MQGSQRREPSVGRARDLLGVAADADAAELGRAYRLRAGRIHPDVSLEPDATEQFRLLQAAYQVALAAVGSETPLVGTPTRLNPDGRTGAPGVTTSNGGIVDGLWLGRERVAWLAAGPVHVEPSPRPSSGTAATAAGERP